MTTVWLLIDCRINEYTYSYDASVKAGGKGDLYLDFLEKTVLPFVQVRTYIACLCDTMCRNITEWRLGNPMLAYLGPRWEALFHVMQVGMR